MKDHLNIQALHTHINSSQPSWTSGSRRWAWRFLRVTIASENTHPLLDRLVVPRLCTGFDRNHCQSHAREISGHRAGVSSEKHNILPQIYMLRFPTEAGEWKEWNLQ